MTFGVVIMKLTKRREQKINRKQKHIDITTKYSMWIARIIIIEIETNSEVVEQGKATTSNNLILHVLKCFTLYLIFTFFSLYFFLFLFLCLSPFILALFRLFDFNRCVCWFILHQMYYDSVLSRGQYTCIHFNHIFNVFSMC